MIRDTTNIVQSVSQIFFDFSCPAIVKFSGKNSHTSNLKETETCWKYFQPVILVKLTEWISRHFAPLVIEKLFK